MLKRLRLACLSLLIGVGLVLVAPTPAQAAVVGVQNDNISIYLVVIAGNGYRHDIPPRVKVNVVSGSESRKVWVRAGCTLLKDGKFFDSSPPSGGHYRNFGFQFTTLNFQHDCW